MIALLVGVILLLLSMGISIVYGYANTSIQTTYESFRQFNNSNEHLIIQNVRIPRALIASCVGASLAITGVLMQTLTKNPLASPGILGINAGAGFAVVFAMIFPHFKLAIFCVDCISWCDNRLYPFMELVSQVEMLLLQ